MIKAAAVKEVLAVFGRFFGGDGAFRRCFGGDSVGFADPRDSAEPEVLIPPGALINAFKMDIWVFIVGVGGRQPFVNANCVPTQ